MTRTQETVAAIVRRYHEWVAAQTPADWLGADQFRTLALFRLNRNDERRMVAAALAVMVLFRLLGQPRPSMKSVAAVLDGVSV